MASLLQAIFARSSITKARNRMTIPVLLLNQNEQIRTKSERHLYQLFNFHSLESYLMAGILKVAQVLFKNKKYSKAYASLGCQQALFHVLMILLQAKVYSNISPLKKNKTKLLKWRQAWLFIYGL